MDSFLKLASKQIFDSHNLEDLRKVQVILPSRRAVYFFKKSLSENSDRPFLSPSVISIDDFVLGLSKLTPLDSIDLYYRIFEIFKRLDEKASFDNFVSIAPVILKDFENIDQALIEHPHELFRYMSEAEAIARWNLEEDFNFTENAQSYFSFFDKVALVYEMLGKELLDEANCYKGMAYRIVANQVLDLVDTNFNKLYFVGLNALSKAEEKIVSTLVKSNAAVTLWDTDNYYMESDIKAGKKLRSYKKSGKYGEWNFQSNLLKESAKNVNIIAVNNESEQARLVSTLIQTQSDDHVIVVLNERMFLPLYLNLPKVTASYNITMGLKINRSVFYGLIEILFDNQISSFGDNTGNLKLHNKRFLKIIEHPFISQILKKESNDELIIEKMKNEINSKNIVFVSLANLNRIGYSSTFLHLFFVDFTNDVFRFFEIIEKIKTKIHAEVELQSLEYEFLEALNTKTLILKTIASKITDVTVKNLMYLFKELFKSESIPFSGSPEASIQIMSMLETRCLDYKNVTFLNLNEGELPSSSKNKTFIPLDAAIYFGLPIYSDQDAIMAYHFFRIMQRAENINLIYLTSGKSSIGSTEKSRFITQIEEELSTYNKNLVLKYPEVIQDTDEHIIDHEIEIEKSDETIADIKNYLSNKGLYPSSINDFFECQLRFYWAKIKGIRKQNEINDKFGNDVFGTLVHETLETIFKPFHKNKQKLYADDFKEIKSTLPVIIESLLIDKYAGYETKTGLNSVLKKVAERILEQYFDSLIESNSSFEIVGLEIFLTNEFSVNVNQEVVKVKLSGIADNISLKNDILEIIDYKTGKVTSGDISNTIKNNEDPLLKPEKGKLRQLLIYKYLLEKSISNKKIEIGNYKGQEVVPRIVSFKNLGENLSLNHIGENTETIIKELTTEIVGDLLNKNKKIVKTQDLLLCTYCDFKEICGR